VNFATWPWARRNRRTAAAFGLESPNFIGRIHTGILTAAVVAEEIRALPEGATELMVHPGYPDAALLHVNTRLRASRAEEVELLRAAEIQHLIAKERIELVRHDLAFPVRRSLRHAS